MQRPISVLIPLLSIALAMGGTAPARAQLRGPPRGLPEVHVPRGGMPTMPHVPVTLPAAAAQHVDDLVHQTPAVTRQSQIGILLREEPRRVTVDPHGEPVLRGEFLALGLAGGQLRAVQAQGFTADSQVSADATLGLDMVVLHDTRGRSEIEALQALQRAAPKVTFAYQHLYLSAGGGDLRQGSASATGPSAAAPRRVGLIDGGVDLADPALARARIEQHGCGTTTVSRHGTAVAARLVDGDPDTLYAADLWCAGQVGGATSSLVNALAWMARERVPVINISLVGPDNPVLARAVRAMIARGHVLVSAVGNDGPAAPPLFPAAYSGVIGVSGVDEHDRVLPESGSGDQVAFCASGVVGRGRDALRGTSFAAPIVARRAAQLLDAPRQGAAAQIVQRLAAVARDLGPPGRDTRYGYGLLSP
ncbi:S8 family serine peptidase [Rhodanobacter terrae]|uniref:S8 family serine peptidase n=1 Tax=Rhodanobacter terrae TaxID=418647 RepID=A0ABW0SZ02_9GAMM